MPFDPTIKRTEGTLRGPDGKTFKCTKGAPHIILKLVEVDQEEVAKRVNWKVGPCGGLGGVTPGHTGVVWVVVGKMLCVFLGIVFFGGCLW